MPKTFLIVPVFSACLLCNTVLAAEAPNEAYSYISTEMPVSGMNLLQTGLHIPGLSVGGDSFDVTFPLDPMTGIFSLGEATPTSLPTQLDLGDLKLSGSFNYWDGVQTQTGDAKLLQQSDDSFAVSFTDGATWSSEIRVVDNCETSNQFYIFAMLLTGETIIPAGAQIDIVKNGQTTMIDGLNENTDFISSICPF